MSLKILKLSIEQKLNAQNAKIILNLIQKLIKCLYAQLVIKIFV